MTLKLTLKRKWFDMIASGEKKEEYREIKDYWKRRLTPYFNYRDYDKVLLRNGYSANAPYILIECNGITKGEAKPEWSDNWQGDVFVIKLGEIIEIEK